MSDDDSDDSTPYSMAPVDIREHYANLVADTETHPDSVNAYLINTLHRIGRKWLIDANQQTITYTTLLTKACSNFNVPASCMPAMNWDRVEDMKAGYLQELHYLIGMFYMRDLLLTKEDARTADVSVRDMSVCYSGTFERIAMSIEESVRLLESLNTIVMASTPSFKVSGDIGIIEFHNEGTQLKPLQHVIQFILQGLYTRNMKRYGDHVYRPIVTPPDADGKTYCTRAYEQWVTIKDYVYTCLNRSVAYSQFLNATDSPSVIPTCIRFITECNDVQFPVLKKNRDVFSFSNGIYITHVLRDSGPYSGQYTDMFIEYAAVNSSNYILDKVLKGDRATCRYINRPMIVIPEDTAWHEIPTPLFSSIIEHQWTTDPSVIESCESRSTESVEENTSIQTMLYCLMGRLLYDLKTLDNWEKMLFFLGRPGCGKSTLTDILCKMYETTDIGTIATKIETVFGLSSLVNKLLVAGPEIKKDCQLCSADLQSMCSAERIEIRTKHVTAESVQWKTPFFMAGNTVPSAWSDAMIRRAATFVFKHGFDDSEKDPELAAKIIAQELPSIIRKINKAYLSIVNELDGAHIDIILGGIKTFQEYTDSIARNTNPLYEFLSHNDYELYRGNSGEVPQYTVAYHPNRSVTKIEVMGYYKTWASLCGYTNIDMQTTFNEHNLPPILDRIVQVKRLGFAVTAIGGWIHGFDFRPSCPPPAESCAIAHARSDAILAEANAAILAQQGASTAVNSLPQQHPHQQQPQSSVQPQPPRRHYGSTETSSSSSSSYQSASSYPSSSRTGGPIQQTTQQPSAFYGSASRYASRPTPATTEPITSVTTSSLIASETTVRPTTSRLITRSITSDSPSRPESAKRLRSTQSDSEDDS